jgi:hypothetical protein
VAEDDLIARINKAGFGSVGREFLRLGTGAVRVAVNEMRRDGRGPTVMVYAFGEPAL